MKIKALKPEPKILCNYLECINGLGMAGNRSCPGNPYIKDCPEFQDEKKFMDEWEKETKINRTTGN